MQTRLITTTSLLRSRMSPKGSRKTSPAAYPTCDAVTIRPATPDPAWKLARIVARRGCA